MEAAAHPPALPHCSISRASWWDQRAGAAAIPGSVRSVEACATSRISGTWAAVPLSSRDGDKSWMGSLELLEGSVWMGQHCWTLPAEGLAPCSGQRATGLGSKMSM